MADFLASQSPFPIPFSEWQASQRLAARWIGCMAYANSRRVNFRGLECPHYGSWLAFLEHFLDLFDPFFALIPQLAIADVNTRSSMAESIQTVHAPKSTIEASCIPDFVVAVFDLWKGGERLESLESINPVDWPDIHLRSHFISIITEIKVGPSRSAKSAGTFTDQIVSAFEEAMADCSKQADIAFKSDSNVKRIIGIACSGEWFRWTIFTRKELLKAVKARLPSETYKLDYVARVTDVSDSLQPLDASTVTPMATTTTPDPVIPSQPVSGAPIPATRLAKKRAKVAITVSKKIEEEGAKRNREHDARKKANRKAKLAAQASAPTQSSSGPSTPIPRAGAKHRWDLDEDQIDVQKIIATSLDIKEVALPRWVRTSGTSGSWNKCSRLFTPESDQQFKIIEQILRNDVLNRDGQVSLEELQRRGANARRVEDAREDYLSDESERGESGNESEYEFVESELESNGDDDGDEKWDDESWFP